MRKQKRLNTETIKMGAETSSVIFFWVLIFCVPILSLCVYLEYSIVYIYPTEQNIASYVFVYSCMYVSCIT